MHVQPPSSKLRLDLTPFGPPSPGPTSRQRTADLISADFIPVHLLPRDGERPSEGPEGARAELLESIVDALLGLALERRETLNDGGGSRGRGDGESGCLSRAKLDLWGKRINGQNSRTE